MIESQSKFTKLQPTRCYTSTNALAFVEELGLNAGLNKPPRSA